MADSISVEDARKELARRELERRRGKSGFDPTSEADAYEKIRGTGALAAATDSSIRGIPFSDEITSAIGSPFRAFGDWMGGEGFDIGRAYNEKQAVEAELQRRRDERHPIASVGGQVAGSIAAAGPVAKAGYSLLQGAKPTLASLMGRGATEGAAYGAVYGAGEGEGLNDRLWNATTGAGLGAAVGGAAGGLARLGAGAIADEAVPSGEQLQAIKDAAYKKAEDAGVIYSPAAMQRILKALIGEFTEFGFHPELHKGARVAISEIDRLKDSNVTLKGLDIARRIAGNAFEPGNKSNNALTAKVVNAIDDVVDNPRAGEVIAGNGVEAAAAIKEARDAFARSRKLELVDTLMQRGKLNAGSAGAGGNIENATRQQLKRILTNPNMTRGFTEAELAALEKAVVGGSMQNLIRLLGKLSPQGNGLMMVMHALGAGTVPMYSLPLAAAGFAAKKGSEAMTRNSARLVEALIATGGKVPPAELSGSRKAIVDALNRSLAVAGP